ncbi:hypothetical protein PIROE2DRAFT_11325 [Piromyces sp. E2]|nr:hypothetical protein PIROE2DRAFT_11325 [Piromyces sp. E2]|eukprot:OUM62374.1 hypothetical protein PIROE2DRAFT_11325 [Piromyces sp. E2]
MKSTSLITIATVALCAAAKNTILQEINNNNNLSRHGNDNNLTCLAQCANINPIAWVKCHLDCLAGTL